MHCPVCKKNDLVAAFLEPSLPCHRCEQCRGTWLYLRDYLRWKELCGDLQSPGASPEGNVEDGKSALLCPDSGRVMLKYRISLQSDRRIDLSPTVNGIWLGPGKWELLKAEGLAAQLDSIFTEPWQRKLRATQLAEDTEEALRRKFGEADYEELKRIAEWMSRRKRRWEMMAYLLGSTRVERS